MGQPAFVPWERHALDGTQVSCLARAGLFSASHGWVQSVIQSVLVMSSGLPAVVLVVLFTPRSAHARSSQWFG
eukprot:275639-Chlamydomonas_euryale.AAC.1